MQPRMRTGVPMVEMREPEAERRMRDVIFIIWFLP